MVYDCYICCGNGIFAYYGLPYCGIVLDRDVNAAKNILRVGQTLQSVTYEDTQGVDCEPKYNSCGMPSQLPLHLN